MPLKIQLIAILSLISVFTHAQLNIGKEITIPLDNEIMQEIQVISLDEDGLILVENIISNYGRKEITNFIRYDSTLTELWRYEYEPPRSYDLTHTYTADEYVFFFFQQDGESGYRIVRLSKLSGQLVAYEYGLLTRMNVTHFTVNGSKALLGGSYNDRAVVEVFNFVENSSKVLPGIYSNHLKVVGLENMQDSGNFSVLIRNTRKCLFFVYQYSYDGKLLESNQVGDKNNVPLGGTLLQFDGNRKLLVGNYADNCSSFSTGFYVHDLQTKKEGNFYDFASIDNYLNYLAPKRRKRMIAKIMSRREKGKEFKIRQRIHLHEMTATENGWLMIAEIYYPEYNSNASTMFLGYRTYREGQQVYNQFNYSHTFIGEFDLAGNMVWNNSINLKNVSTRQLNDITQLTKIDRGYMLAYPDDGIIRTSIINSDNEILPMQNYDLKAVKSQSKIIDVNSSNLFAWYGQTFLVYGDKRVNTGNEYDAKDVFYLRKLSYVPNQPTKDEKAN
jgi:hypothetical protein